MKPTDTMTDDTKPESASEFNWYDSDMLLAAVNVDGGSHRTKEDYFIHGAYWQFCKHQDYYDRQEKTISYLRAALKFYANTGGGIAIDALARTEPK